MLVHPREQRCPRRAATRGIIKLRKAKPIRRQFIQRRRLNLTALATDVRKAHVVGHDDDDVWLLGCLQTHRLAKRQ